MKVRTVGALAALGMLLTSYSVWSLTDETSSGRRALLGGDTPIAIATSHSDTIEATNASGGSLHLVARLGNARLPRGNEETFVLVNVRADASVVGRPTARELTIAIDRSGSMSGKRLSNAIAAARGAVARLADGDTVSVVDYSNAAHLLVTPTVLGPETRAAVDARLSTLTAGGETCISCALDTALDLVRGRNAGVERVLLLSDGEATTGVRSVDGMRRLGDRLRAAGATVTTIGVDVDYNERVMTAIAQAANGHHYFVASPEGLTAIFDRELTGLERAVAREAKVEIELEPGVELVEVLDHGFERDGSRVSVALGSFAAGEERSVLARVRVASDAAGERPIATARIRYDDLASGKPAESESELVAQLSDDGSRSPLDPEVEERVQRSGAAAALNTANDLFNAGDAVAAREHVAKKLDEVRREREVAIAAAPAPAKASLAERFDAQEVALGAAASAFAEPPPSASSNPVELRKSKAVVKENAERAADLAF
jgi:Ca-activated chloride channel family protein